MDMKKILVIITLLFMSSAVQCATLNFSPSFGGKHGNEYFEMKFKNGLLVRISENKDKKYIGHNRYIMQFYIKPSHVSDTVKKIGKEFDIHVPVSRLEHSSQNQGWSGEVYQLLVSRVIKAGVRKFRCGIALGGCLNSRGYPVNFPDNVHGSLSRRDILSGVSRAGGQNPASSHKLDDFREEVIRSSEYAQTTQELLHSSSVLEGVGVGDSFIMPNLQFLYIIQEFCAYFSDDVVDSGVLPVSNVSFQAAFTAYYMYMYTHNLPPIFMQATVDSITTHSGSGAVTYQINPTVMSTVQGHSENTLPSFNLIIGSDAMVSVHFEQLMPHEQQMPGQLEPNELPTLEPVLQADWEASEDPPPCGQNAALTLITGVIAYVLWYHSEAILSQLFGYNFK